MTNNLTLATTKEEYESIEVRGCQLAGFGHSEISFQMYDSFEVKTGGYSAEFGRSTDGVVNAVPNRGKNDAALGEANPDYGLATNYQSLRYVRLSASFKF